MFKNLVNFTYKRSAKEAIGFYLAYLILYFVLGALLGSLSSLITGDISFSGGVKTGALAVAIITPIFSFFILNKKNLLSFGYILLALVSGILAYWGGGILGLIPVAYITTRK